MTSESFMAPFFSAGARRDCRGFMMVLGIAPWNRSLLSLIGPGAGSPDLGTGSEVHLLAPARVEVQREDPLDGLGAPGSGLDERLESLPQLGEPRIGMFAVPRRRAVDPVED